MQTWIDWPFADGVYTFKLGAAQIAELQRRCGWTDKDGNAREIGIFALNARLMAGAYFRNDLDLGRVWEFKVWEAEALLNDVVQTIRQGLIGGGEALVDGETVKVSPARVNELIASYVLNPDTGIVMPLEDAWSLAVKITSALISGYDPKKKDALDDQPQPPPQPHKRRTRKDGSTTSDSSPTAQ